MGARPEFREAIPARRSAWSKYGEKGFIWGLLPRRVKATATGTRRSGPPVPEEPALPGHALPPEEDDRHGVSTTSVVAVTACLDAALAFPNYGDGDSDNQHVVLRAQPSER